MNSKSLLAFAILCAGAFVSVKSHAENRIACRSLEILYRNEQYVLVNREDRLIPFLRDLEAGKILALQKLDPGFDPVDIADAAVTVENVIPLDSRTAAVKVHVRTINTPLTFNWHTRRYEFEARTWTICR